MKTSALGILTVNIGNPSLQRAERQLGWLDARDEDVFVLTETCDSRGTDLLVDRLRGAGWDVVAPVPRDGDRGVVVASRVRLEAEQSAFLEDLPARAVRVAVTGGPEVIGVYVPSRDASERKTDRKREFVAALSRALRARHEHSAVLVGDLNVVEPNHQPRRPEFFAWEYALYEDLLDNGWADAYRLLHPDARDHSWTGPDDDGYRFDHAFVTADLADGVMRCGYAHETRELGLTDHSALTLTIPGAQVLRLAVEPSLTRDPMALF